MSLKTLSGLSLGSVSTSECDFLAKETLIEISPKFSHPKLKFISGEFGPFDPMLTVYIPLWLAVTLRKKEKCRIVIPDWLLLEHLQQCVEVEKTSVDFVEMPPHFLEVAAILFDCCKEDIENADRVFGLLQDLENIRADRLRIGMRTVAAASFGGKKVDLIRLKNVSSMEVLSIKSFFLQSLQMFEKLLAAPQVMDSRNEAGDEDAATTSNAVGGRKLRKYRN